MIAAVLTPGPSLSRIASVDLSPYHATWAVNTAIKLVRADWLAAGDPEAVKRSIGNARPRLGLLTMGSTAKQVADCPTWHGLHMTTWSDIPLIEEHEKRGRPLSWSVQTALCHAAHFGAERIDLYGCDIFRPDFDPWQTADAAGYHGEDRNRQRWERERLDLELTTQLLAESGTTIKRIDL